MADDDRHQKWRSMEAFSPIDEEIFSPIGFHVLVVDNDTLFLAALETIPRKCQYNVTRSTSVSQAISLAMENKHSFDIVMSEVHFVGEDGFKILDVVGVGLGLPVIMMSVSGETNVVMRGITGGACNYLIKPIRTEEVRTLWQHVIRRRGRQYRHLVKLKDGHGDLLESTASKNGKQGSRIIKDINGLKDTRMYWTLELHQQFLNAVNQSGVDKVVPNGILEIMNVPGLTRDNVASHLQKYRLYLKRLRGIIPEQRPVASFQASGQGKPGGTMQIRQGGKTSFVSPSPSSGSSSYRKETHFRRVELGGRNLDRATVESLEQFRWQEQPQKLAASNTVQVVVPHLVVPLHSDQGSEGGPVVNETRQNFHVGCLRKNKQDRVCHQSQLQNPSPTGEIIKKNEAYHHEGVWSRDELRKFYAEDIQFNNFVEDETNFPAALSEEYD